MTVQDPAPDQHGIPRRMVLEGGAATALAVLATSMASSPASATFASRHAILLAGFGLTQYRIFLGRREGLVVQHAAQELARHLRSVTGARFDVVMGDRPPGGHGHLIVLGTENTFAERAGIDTHALGDDGFAFRTNGNTVIVAGASPRGTLYGTYWLLDRLVGIRWYAPDFAYVPRRLTLSIPRADLSGDHVPRFRFRTVLAGDAEDAAYRQHNMLNGLRDQYWTVPREPGIDTWSHYWPEEVKHSFQQVVTDPALWAGGQLKAMDEATRVAATAGLVRIINERIADGQDPSSSFYQEDRVTWEMDPASRAFADAHGGAPSAPVIDMVNDVAARVRAQIPDARLETQAYWFTYDPPTGIRVSDDVVLTVAPIHADFGDSLFGEKNAVVGAHIRTWADLAEHVVLWDYLCTFTGYILPFPNWWAMGEGIQELATLPNVQGYFGQSAWNARGTEFTQLRVWVISRLLWDPTADPDALIREFLEGYYGRADDAIYAYMQLMVSAVERTGTNLGVYIGENAGHLRFETLHQADALFDRAERAVRGNRVLLDHVRAVRLGIDYLLLLRSGFFQLVAERDGIAWEADVPRRLARFRDEIRAAGLTQYAETGGDPAAIVAHFEAMAAAEAREATPPAAVAGLPATDWVDYQEPTFTLYLPSASLVEDAQASNGYAVRMPGNNTAWAVQLPLEILPAGRWKIYITLRADVGTASPGALAVETGIWPPFGNSLGVPVSDLADGAYHELALPGTYERATDHTYAFAGPLAPAGLQNVFVDRIFAVRQ
ncbi:DUF4838 domain-containing protein [Georgenia faecalis]|uniref:DUF4838 domain-containing protein n=1 Tax=Georgenia faecalis TaxID=2483799 RepID=A0ABV9DAD3_9MICO|nr:DUF4838 domain-containing protein [Georgenia faecalis]